MPLLLLILALIHTMMQDMMQGQADEYYDGIENIRGDSYDDACRYKGKKRKEYELGYEEGYDAGFDDGFADSDYDSEEEE